MNAVVALNFRMKGRRDKASLFDRHDPTAGLSA